MIPTSIFESLADLPRAACQKTEFFSKPLARLRIVVGDMQGLVAENGMPKKEKQDGRRCT